MLPFILSGEILLLDLSFITYSDKLLFIVQLL